MTLVKCDYIAERWAVLAQLSQLVGCIWITVQWACGNRSEPAFDWGYKIMELRKVAGWHLETLEAHQHEWVGNPIVVHYLEVT